MPDQIDFYFDFSSSYSYIAHRKVVELGERLGVPVVWRPISLGAIFAALGHQLPETGSPKQKYIWHDVVRSARENGLPYIWPDPFPVNSIPAMRGFYFLDAQPGADTIAYANAIFKATFGEGRDIGNPDVLLNIVGGLGANVEAFKTAISSAQIKQKLKQETDAAMQLGIFGAPSFVVDGELFWGADRLEAVERLVSREKV